MSILWMIIFGAIVGAIAKLLMPGRDPGGIIVTIILGILGSVLGAFVARALTGGSDAVGANWIGSILGAMLLLFLYRMFTRNRTVVP